MCISKLPLTCELFPKTYLWRLEPIVMKSIQDHQRKYKLYQRWWILIFRKLHGRTLSVDRKIVLSLFIHFVVYLYSSIFGKLLFFYFIIKCFFKYIFSIRWTGCITHIVKPIFSDWIWIFEFSEFGFNDTIFGGCTIANCLDYQLLCLHVNVLSTIFYSYGLRE